MATPLSPRSVRRNAQKFQENEKASYEALKETVEPILEKMTWGTDETILDHGHNSGKKIFEILAPLAEKTSSTVYILDDCPYTIDYVEMQFPHAKIKHIYGDLSLPPGTLSELKFNKIFSLYGMYYTTDYRSALQSMYDHLLPGGEAFFMIPTKTHVFDLNGAMIDDPEFGEHAEEHFPVPDYIHDGKDNSGILKDAFVNSGFELKMFDVVKRVIEFKNVKEFTELCLSINPFLLLLPKRKQDALEAFYYKYISEAKTEFYDPATNSPDDKYVYPYECASVYVSKPE